MKVFIIEDSKLVAERLIKLINLINNVEICGHSDNIEASIKMMSSLKPDFIVLDVIVNGVNSLDYLGEIIEKNPNATISVFTNYPYNVLKSYSENYGVKHFFDKSKDLESMLELIRKSATSV